MDMVLLRIPSTPSQIARQKTFACNLNFLPNTINHQWLSILKSCSSMKQLFQIHALILISGLHSNKYVTDAIIHFCASNRFGSLSYASFVIEHSENSLPSSWNDLIRAYANKKGDSCELTRETIWVFTGMRRSCIIPDVFTYPFLFKSCATYSALEDGRQIHADALKRGFDSDVYVSNTMIHFYGSCKKIVDARKVFDQMSHRNVVSWNSVISALVRVSWFYESVEYFVKMRSIGFEPNETTMVVMLSVCTELGNLTMGKWVHSQIIEKGMELTCQLGTALVDMYSKCGALSLASIVFDKMPLRNVWTWSAMILGLAQHGFARDALALFEKMKDSSFRPNNVTFLGVICACSHAGAVEEGRRLFDEMRHVYGIKPQLIHYGAMVDVLGRAGRLKEAYDFIVNMPIKPDPSVWRSLLSACNIHDAYDFDGVGEKARENLLILEPKRSGNLVILANKYAEVGKWEKAAEVRKGMRARKLKKMAGESCTERFSEDDKSSRDSESESDSEQSEFSEDENGLNPTIEASLSKGVDDHNHANESASDDSRRVVDESDSSEDEFLS